MYFKDAATCEHRANRQCFIFANCLFIGVYIHNRACIIANTVCSASVNKLISGGAVKTTGAFLPSSGSPCTGCGLCASVCGSGAIRMVENEEGFLVPRVDEAACIGCKACEKMCARLALVGGRECHRFYEAWSLDETQRAASSSGGVFSELAQDCIRRGGVVYGVTMKGGEFPRFVAVERLDDMALLRGSKYLQADTGDVFRQMATVLKAGRPVLFAGVSCQVRAARVRYGELYDNLLLVDLACFGVPSRHVWRSFLRELANGGEITGVSFRDKDRNWQEYSMRIEYGDGTRTMIHKEDNPFMRGFLCHLGLNECCYTCRSAVDDRPGDISLGDFWGRPRQDDEHNGVSVVIPHTPKGEAAMERIRPALHLELADESRALADNGGLIAHTGGIPLRRTAFLRALRSQPLHHALTRFLDSSNRPRPGILLCNRFIPCPALLRKLARKIRKLTGWHGT